MAGSSRILDGPSKLLGMREVNTKPWIPVHVSLDKRAAMSVMGQERSLAALDFMSALPPITDIAADMGITDLTSEVV